MTLFFPDLSNNNWSADQNPQQVTDFLALLPQQGFAGVAHKVTQGNDFQDWAWPVAQQWCQENNFPIIGYHYVDTSDPDEQADNYVNCHGTRNVMFDFEDGSGDLGNFWVVVDAFNNAGINVQLGYIPNWYLNSAEGGYLSLAPFAVNGIQLVSSAYPDGLGLAADIYARSGGDTGEGWDSYNGGTPSAWQFTNAATIGRYNVDCNAYKGTDIYDLFGR